FFFLETGGLGSALVVFRCGVRKIAGSGFPAEGRVSAFGSVLSGVGALIEEGERISGKDKRRPEACV
ncbi:hypothetical protein U1Q18_007729, partial [Sarracenia purpurea var. burkii]